MNAALEFDRVTLRYRPQDALVLEQCSFRIDAGERVALLGLNGCGKTTVLLAATGLLPFEGAITVDGITLTPRSAGRVRTRLGFLFSSPDHQILFPRVIDDVAFALARQGCSHREAEQRADAMLDAL